MRAVLVALVVGCNAPYTSGLRDDARLSRLDGAEMCELVVGGVEHQLKRLSDDELCYVTANLAASAEAAARGQRFDKGECESAYALCANLGIGESVLFDEAETNCDTVKPSSFAVSDACEASVADYESCIDEQVDLLERWAGLACRKPIFDDEGDFSGGVPKGCVDVLAGGCAPGSGR